MLVKPDGSPLRPTASYEVAPSTPPFNYAIGEQIGDLGPDYVIAPLSKWSDTPIIDAAVRQAVKTFTGKRNAINVPSPVPSEPHILIQEYPAQDRLAIVVAAWGRQMGMRTYAWLYHTTVIKLSPQLKNHLLMTNRWKAGTRH